MVKKIKRKRRPSIARTPSAVVSCKKRFLTQLANGLSPGDAADHVKVKRQTFYEWRKNDEAFDAAWKDAAETGLDKVETGCMLRAIKEGSIVDAHFMLRYRRYDRERIDRPQSNFVVNITLQERLERLERLGLPLPVFETDYDDDKLLENGDAPEGNT